MSFDAVRRAVHLINAAHSAAPRSRRPARSSGRRASARRWRVEMQRLHVSGYAPERLNILHAGCTPALHDLTTLGQPRRVLSRVRPYRSQSRRRVQRLDQLRPAQSASHQFRRRLGHRGWRQANGRAPDHRGRPGVDPLCEGIRFHGEESRATAPRRVAAGEVERRLPRERDRARIPCAAPSRRARPPLPGSNPRAILGLTPIMAPRSIRDKRGKSRAVPDQEEEFGSDLDQTLRQIGVHSSLSSSSNVTGHRSGTGSGG